MGQSGSALSKTVHKMGSKCAQKEPRRVREGHNGDREGQRRSEKAKKPQKMVS